uniref:Uncharacterized protein n=1 Tax=Rhizophora mucronata TaxID=61149 RepID=A0A2P2P523_RHIMU
MVEFIRNFKRQANFSGEDMNR